MNKATTALLCAVAVLFCCCGADWPQFRGPAFSNQTQDSLPTSWSESENIAWKADLPGRGLSGPIVIGDRVFLTACSGIRQDRLHVLCFAAESGDKLWERQFYATGRTMTHSKTCTAAPTPVSDGQRVFALFSSNDLFCLDLDGNLLWLRGLTQQYPNASNSLGMASSPIVVDGTLIVKLETDSESVAVALASETGELQWSVDRPKLASWTSPFMMQRQNGQAVVALQSGKGLSGYDIRSGELVWSYDQGCSTIPSGVTNGTVAFVPSNGLVALRDDEESVSPEVLWEESRLGPSTSSPLLLDNRVLVMNRSILKCADAETGKLIWQRRLKGNFTSSPISDGRHIFVFNEDGLGQVVDSREGEIVAGGGGDLQETILCTPAVAAGALYVRSDAHLFKIAANAASGS